MLTMLPQPGSPAIDAGDPLFATPPLFDQRGAPFIRIDSGRTDMGSVETQSQFPGPDLDGDGDADCDDINALTQAIASGAYMPGFDMNLDGVLNILDIERWLCKAGNLNLGPNLSYRVGDANLDGFVDGSDFGLWNANKFTNNSAWCAGNFNSDGVVDGADFGLWNANKFQGAFACNPLPRGSKRCQVELPPIVDVVIAEWPIPIRDTHGQVAATPETSFRDKRITRSKKISGA